MSVKQSPDDFALIGIYVMPQCVELYHCIFSIGQLDENLSQWQTCGYEFCYNASGRIQQVLRRGYSYQLAQVGSIFGYYP